MDFWNKKDLNGPPVLTYATKQRMLNLPEFTSHFTNTIQFTSNDSFLKQEAALLSRIIYKLKYKFSKEKFLNAMEKTNKALLLYLQLDLQTLLTSYKDSIPAKYEEKTYFPSIDMLDFVLVRLQGACKLLIRMRDSARIAALYLGDKLIIGHFWKVILLCFGIVSRIAQVGNEICRFFSNLYDKLLKYRTHFKNAGIKWLPDDYSFPLSMQTWLDVEFDVSATDNLQTYDLSLADSVKAYNYLSSIPIDSDSNTDDVELVDEYFDLDNSFRSKKNKHKANANDKRHIASVCNAMQAGPIFNLDSNEDENCSYGVEVDKYGNPLHSRPTNIMNTDHNKISNDRTVPPNTDIQSYSTFETFSHPGAKKRNSFKYNAAMEKVLEKIFTNQSSIGRKSQPQTGKFRQSHKKKTKQNQPECNTQKQNYETRNVYLNLNSKRAFYEFLNEQQKLLRKNNESSVFSHLNMQKFIKLRKQIQYVMNKVNLPKEETYEKCKEILYDNMNKKVQRIG